MEKDCTLLLSSYDGGEDLWEGFFTSLKVQWPELDMPIVLNTETKNYTFPGYEIKTFALCKDSKMPWAKRLKETLHRIDTDYILLFLEDYWLDDRVDNEYFEKSLNWLRNNEDIATFSYYPCMPDTNIQDEKFERMELRPQACEYKLNCQVSVWRREKLIAYLRDHEDPWEWEIWGSMRASRYKERFYTLKPGAKPVFSYGDPAVGCLIHRGKWVEDAARRLCDMYDLNIDFSIRGFEDFDEFFAQINEKRTLRQRIFQRALPKKIYNRIKYAIRKCMSLI